MIESYITEVRIFAALIMLFGATYLDIKRREVHDIFWIVFGAITVMLLLLQSGDHVFLVKTSFSALLIIPSALVLWKVGVVGGADAFALMILSSLVPFLTYSTNPVTPFTIITNSAFFSLSILILNAIKNTKAVLGHEDVFEGFAESNKRKLAAFFLGCKEKTPRYGFSIQKQYGNIKKFDFSFKHAEKTEFCNIPNTWITPATPFMLYITAGFVAQIAFGDFLLMFFQFILT